MGEPTEFKIPPGVEFKLAPGVAERLESLGLFDIVEQHFPKPDERYCRFGVDMATKVNEPIANALKDELISWVGANWRVSGRVTFVGRYLRDITHKECAILRKAGLKLLSISEYSDEPDSINRAAGAVDAERALSKAKEFGQPAGTPIYFAIDFSVDASNPSKMQDVFAYFEEIERTFHEAESGYLIGVYGNNYVLQNIYRYPLTHFGKWLCNAFWQSTSMNFKTQMPDGTPVPVTFPLADMWQRNNRKLAVPGTAQIQVDDNLSPWGREGSWEPPA